MSVIGHSVSVVNASDPTIVGRSGDVVLETANTLLLSKNGRSFRIQKKGTVLALADSNQVVAGKDVLGRLEDRLRLKNI